MKDLTLPIALIALGALWLLHNLDWIPDLRWAAVWILIGSGALNLILEGINKKTVVGGPLLIGLGLLWAARLRHYLDFDLLLPSAIILLGVLMLIARHPAIPETRARKNPDPPAL
jgi:hypothetical protein